MRVPSSTFASKMQRCTIDLKKKTQDGLLHNQERAKPDRSTCKERSKRDVSKTTTLKGSLLGCRVVDLSNRPQTCAFASFLTACYAVLTYADIGVPPRGLVLTPEHEVADRTASKQVEGDRGKGGGGKRRVSA